ncbi:MAG: hypothetical protein NTX77_03600, partial [Actinobacteria bacterium]|nr:hypothetical protein [Actinomycetota bacterium]
DADQWALNALAESCAVIPARASMAGSHVGVRQVNIPLAAGASPGRFALRVGTLFALLAVVLSIAPIDVAATAPVTRRVVGTVVADETSTESVSGISVVAVCSTNAGPDGAFGTADDAYGTVLSTTTDALGQYGLDVTGEACWLSVEPPLPDGRRNRHHHDGPCVDDQSPRYRHHHCQAIKRFERNPRHIACSDNCRRSGSFATEESALAVEPAG